MELGNWDIQKSLKMIYIKVIKKYFFYYFKDGNWQIDVEL